MRKIAIAVSFVLLSSPLGIAATSGAITDTAQEDQQIAEQLAAMLRAGRAVISQSQSIINDPTVHPKGLDGDMVLARSVEIYRKTVGTDPKSLSPDTRMGRLLGYEMAAIKEVLDANQGTINAPGVAFKGFIPAVFSRLVSEAFSRRAHGEAEMKVTAPLGLVRNRKVRPDSWEATVINDKFLAADWPRGHSFEANIDESGTTFFRVAVPEYYSATCLSCHGNPKGDVDITGYPKEGASVGDLGGVISIKLKRT